MHQLPEILSGLRQAIERYHGSMRWDAAVQKHRDPFIDWYRRSFGNGSEGNLRLRILLILVNARFDQGARAERALENTQRVVRAGLLNRDHISLDEVPPLNTRQRMRADRWRELFWRSLPGLRELANRIAGTKSWKAGNLLQAITRAKIPYFGPKTARLAVRWLSELIPEISIDMADAEVPVDSLVYRVAARLGLIDPDCDKYWGPGSPGHQKIQEAARRLFPHDPSLMDEPIWMMGRQSRNGGFCYPTNPACDRGCLFAAFCPRLWQDRDPVTVGYSAPSPKPARKQSPISCSRPSTRTVRAVPATIGVKIQPRPVPGLLVIVSCVKNKIWDVDPSTPTRSPAGAAYVGSYFSKNRAYAMTFGEAWCVLSAKFGLVLPDDEIENYNVTFKHRTSELVTAARLKEQVVAKGLDRFQVVQVLGGREYVDHVVAAFAGNDVRIAAPLAGLRIGEAMHAVQKAVDSGSPL